VKVKYFEDTDTLLVMLSSRPITETRDLGEDVLVELDEQGHLVSVTIEHAKTQTDLREFSYELASAAKTSG
jgi:uncharacterized protein YuzE